MREQTACPVCEGASFEALRRLTLTDVYAEPETRLRRSESYHRNWILFERILKREVKEYQVEFRLCSNCGLIYFSPSPDEGDMAIKYQFAVESSNTIQRDELRRLVDLRADRAKAIYRRLSLYWKTASGRAVDVGGSDGHCLGELTRRFDCGVLDFETREMWDGVRKIGDTLDDLDASDQFDVILCCHTLEHIPDVLSFTRRMSEHLTEDGILYVEVPYGCAGEIYDTKDILTHLQFFSEGSLGYMLESAGLSVEFVNVEPVLSQNRYLPVCVAIGRKMGAADGGTGVSENAYAVTRRQMTQRIDGAVVRANMKLVMSHPVQYAREFARRAFRTHINPMRVGASHPAQSGGKH